jgi:hypothetical protein
MNMKRTATIAIAGGAVAAWFAGAATSNYPPPQPAVFSAPAIDVRGEALSREIQRLHERLRPTASPRQPGRNLFTFHAAPTPAPVAAPPPAVPAAIVEAPVAAPPPALKLSGISEDPGDEGPVRMAFIVAGGQLLMVKEGEPVTPRYRVVKISADVVELTDLLDNTTRRLALR